MWMMLVVKLCAFHFIQYFRISCNCLHLHQGEWSSIHKQTCEHQYSKQMKHLQEEIWLYSSSDCLVSYFTVSSIISTKVRMNFNRWATKISEPLNTLKATASYENFWAAEHIERNSYFTSLSEIGNTLDIGVQELQSISHYNMCGCNHLIVR
jgi:hypothetical protein